MLCFAVCYVKPGMIYIINGRAPGIVAEQTDPGIQVRYCRKVTIPVDIFVKGFVFIGYKRVPVLVAIYGKHAMNLKRCRACSPGCYLGLWA